MYLKTNKFSHFEKKTNFAEKNASSLGGDHTR